MKKVVLLVCLTVFCVSVCFSQIKTSSIKNIETKEKKTSYDSISNYVGKNYYQYVGQTLYVPKERNKENFGYDHFNKKDITGSYYKQRSGHYDTRYDAVAGKYFDVLDIVKSNKFGTIFLKIKEQKSGDIIYFVYDVKDERFFPFIVVGYFEKQKRLLIGSKFPLSRESMIFHKVKDINNNPVKYEPKIGIKKENKEENYFEEWKCIDYSIEEDFFWSEVVILEDKDGYKIKTTPKDLDDLVKITLRVDSEMKDYNKAVEKYGNLRVGISVAGVRALLGSPDHINTTKTTYGTSEQWVYKDKYVYIEDGKVTAIQEEN